MTALSMWYLPYLNQMYCPEGFINDHFYADINKKYDEDINSF